LKVLYGLEPAAEKPTLAPQAKSLGGKCGYQAEYVLRQSIPDIPIRLKEADYVFDMMVKTVKDIKWLIANGHLDDRPDNHPGDEELEVFSVHAFLSMNQGMCQPYKYFLMRSKSGSLLSYDWLLRRTYGYFIVYGSREDGDLVVTEKQHKKFVGAFHFLAVNVKKKLVIDNKNVGGFRRLCKEIFVATEKPKRKRRGTQEEVEDITDITKITDKKRPITPCMQTVHGILGLYKFVDGEYITDF
jgi:hypothetical protein